MDILALLESYEFEMKDIRRYLHQHPELSYQEKETSQFITAYYDKLGVSYKKILEGMGVVATICGKLPGKTIAIRADFDALPIQDAKDVPYKSKRDGVMHACGHDGHTAILLVIGKVLHECRDNLYGQYKLIHQPAEEVPPGGAIQMIHDGCLEGVDAIFGTHLWATSPVGTVSTRTGPLMAKPDNFTISFKGRGGHAAQPHRTQDSLLAASSFIVQAQSIVSRKVDPLHPSVLSITNFDAPHALNVIGDRCTIGGTVRTFQQDVQDIIVNEMKQLIEGIKLFHGVDVEFVYHEGYPAVVNHEEETHYLMKSAEEILTSQHVTQASMEMGGEDFSYYLQHVKGCFFFTGALQSGKTPIPHHHPLFDLDEDALLVAAKVLTKTATEYSREKATE
ncbi:peptidase M20 [Bacillus coahuilensis p1.1.43]|uniref:Peptidase M20 n=1 Tax=Bacillus coahuilensis p1.1.43 TaxID=1150625 RepID=A0A147KB50_9BACI|nr:amidohydrolase [Bacillus coahuilensis]KUP07955.1 peptidase M20 [Bacillus coahuilensis p1.1.43]